MRFDLIHLQNDQDTLLLGLVMQINMGFHLMDSLKVCFMAIIDNFIWMVVVWNIFYWNIM